MKITVKEAIEKLQKLDPGAILQAEFNGPPLCDTCGFGSEVTEDITNIIDLENKVVFSVLSQYEPPAPTHGKGCPCPVCFDCNCGMDGCIHAEGGKTICQCSE